MLKFLSVKTYSHLPLLRCYMPTNYLLRELLSLSSYILLTLFVASYSFTHTRQYNLSKVQKPLAFMPEYKLLNESLPIINTLFTFQGPYSPGINLYRRLEPGNRHPLRATFIY
jgi:hypothetical protein